MSGPLRGLKVVDLSRILAGPWASQVLADFGAEVIKIESTSGDDTRRWGPPWVEDTTDAAYYTAANRGKKSICVDLKSERGQRLVKHLVKDADVFIENFKVGGLKKFGLDYDRLSAINPGLVYCSITGFGQTGPKASQAGYDAMIQGAGGLMSITGPSDEDSDAGPQKVGVAVADLMTGMYAVTAIQAALLYRHQTGEGQYIDLALFDTQAAWLANQSANYLVGGMVPTRQGTAHPNIAPYQAIKAKDGHFMLAVGNDLQFAKLAATLGNPEWKDDARFATNADRVKHRHILIPMIEAKTTEFDRAYWLDCLAKQSVPVGPINTIDQVFSDEQISAREMIISQVRSDGAMIKTVANPVKFSKTQCEYLKAPPVRGADSEQVLSEAGYSREEIDHLIELGVVNRPS